ncbi:hypothetical protein DFH07DRAFT_944233 [Mycena maculata]|uniref:Uncharacterized protein n=1 Tax=Mycena maculata TaxID=230809 RepID=A0AAD7MZH9_9AGAR|nr:hypothetical protein DFH07DRAFT_944233 [Mycena maculata]
MSSSAGFPPPDVTHAIGLIHAAAAPPPPPSASPSQNSQNSHAQDAYIHSIQTAHHNPALFQAYPDGTLQATMEKHYDTFIAEQDIAQIAGAGLNGVIPFWDISPWSDVGSDASGPGTEPFLEGGCVEGDGGAPARSLREDGPRLRALRVTFLALAAVAGGAPFSCPGARGRGEWRRCPACMARCGALHALSSHVPPTAEPGSSLVAWQSARRAAVGRTQSTGACRVTRSGRIQSRLSRAFLRTPQIAPAADGVIRSPLRVLPTRPRMRMDAHGPAHGPARHRRRRRVVPRHFRSWQTSAGTIATPVTTQFRTPTASLGSGLADANDTVLVMTAVAGYLTADKQLSLADLRATVMERRPELSFV